MRKLIALLIVAFIAMAIGFTVNIKPAHATSTCPNGSTSTNEYQTGYYRDRHVPALGNSMQDVFGLGGRNVYSGYDIAYIMVSDPYDKQQTWMQAGIVAGTDNVEHPYIEVFDGNSEIKHTVYSDVLNPNNQYTFTIDHFSGGDYHAVVPGGHNFTYGFVNQNPKAQGAQAEIQNPSKQCNVYNAAWSGIAWGSTCTGSCLTLDAGDPSPYIISNYDNVLGFSVVGP